MSYCISLSPDVLSSFPGKIVPLAELNNSNFLQAETSLVAVHWFASLFFKVIVLNFLRLSSLFLVRPSFPTLSHPSPCLTLNEKFGNRILKGIMGRHFGISTGKQLRHKELLWQLTGWEPGWIQWCEHGLVPCPMMLEYSVNTTVLVKPTGRLTDLPERQG